MTAATEIKAYERKSPGRGAAPQISQATAIEQQRAIAEVQAAVVVAQSCPRDLEEAEAEMEYVCGRLDMAEQAFYQVTNRGTGASVHLMRELARIWGNVQFGVNELHRSDEKGESEVQAWAWDMQRNTRSSRTFIVPHQRMATVDGVKKRRDLTDLQDIYLNNQNVGARAVRECIGTILPRWFTEKAQDICRATIERGDGQPLQERIALLVDWYGQMGVSEKQLAARVDKPRGQWTARDVAQFKIAGKSILAGEAQKDDLFPPMASSTSDEITAAAPAPEPVSEADPPADPGQGGENDQGEAAEPSSGSATPLSPGDQEPPADPEPIPEPEKTTRQRKTDAKADKPEMTAMRRSLEARLFKLLGQLKVEDRGDRIKLYRAILERPEVNSTDDLNDTEVTKIADQLYKWQRDGIAENEIREALNAETIREDNTADDTQEQP